MSDETLNTDDGDEASDAPDFGEVVDVLGIGNLLDRRTHLLSGGERQRVAIGHLSAPRLCVDEPLASLDAERKAEIIPFVSKVQDQFRLPIVYVSHSVEEVLWPTPWCSSQKVELQQSDRWKMS